MSTSASAAVNCLISDSGGSPCSPLSRRPNRAASRNVRSSSLARSARMDSDWADTRASDRRLTVTPARVQARGLDVWISPGRSSMIDYFGAMLRDCLDIGPRIGRPEFPALLTDDVRLHALAGRVAAAE